VLRDLLLFLCLCRGVEDNYEFPIEDEIHSTRFSRKYQESNDYQSNGDQVIINAHNYSKGEVAITEKLVVLTEGYEVADEGSNDNNFYATLCKEQTPLQEGEVPLDVENNPLLWIAPPPEHDEDLFGMKEEDDDDEYSEINESEGLWCHSGSLRSLNSYGHKSKDKSATDEQRKAMRAVVDGHFRVLVSQLLNGEGVHTDESGHQSWLEIVTSLSLQAASVVKPNTDGGMDPGGYVKIKCITSGKPNERFLSSFALISKLIMIPLRLPLSPQISLFF
jgi:hypothetical protein